MHETLLDAKILHRDISSNNIMLSPSKNEGEHHQCLVIDFDYAFVVDLSVDRKVENAQAIVHSDEARNKNQEDQENMENVQATNPTRDKKREVLIH